MKLDHVGLNVADPAASIAFYEALLGPLGLARCAAVQGWTGFGAEGRASFWVGGGPRPPQPTHVAFAVASRRDVDEFHRLALSRGARIQSAPAERPEYHPNFYSAMVLDPDGHNLEVVCHADAATPQTPACAETPAAGQR